MKSYKFDTDNLMPPRMAHSNAGAGPSGLPHVRLTEMQSYASDPMGSNAGLAFR